MTDDTPAVGTHPGRVLQAAGGVYTVELDGGRLLEAVLRGRIKREERTGDRVVAGDEVEVALAADGSATIETVRPRRTELARRAPGHGRTARAMVANVDRVAAVFAYERPMPRLRLLDRFLVLAESNDLPAVVIANKLDLRGDDDPFALYERVGYEVLRTSVTTGAGLERLGELLAAGTTVLTGPSGVGKSSLLNALDPTLSLRVGEVSEAVGKGRHTTVTARLIPLEGGGYVADTPGLRELGLWSLEPELLAQEFREFRPFLDGCRFGHSCHHDSEPGCAVRQAIQDGEIAPARHESYLALRAELEQSARRY